MVHLVIPHIDTNVRYIASCVIGTVKEERKTDKGKESPHYESGDA